MASVHLLQGCCERSFLLTQALFLGKGFHTCVGTISDPFLMLCQSAVSCLPVKSVAIKICILMTVSRVSTELKFHSTCNHPLLENQRAPATQMLRDIQSK